MAEKNTQYKTFYDSELAIDVLCKYFDTHDKETIEKTSFRKIYDNVLAQNPDVKLPKYSQMRKYVLEWLEYEGWISKGEKITSSVAYRLLGLYQKDINYYFQEYEIETLEEKVIPCVISLPEPDIMRDIMIAMKKQIETNRTKFINNICRKIKKENQKTVLAAIPESNLIIKNDSIFEKNQKLSREYNPVFSCSAICLFVLDNEEGREFIKSITNKNAIVQYI